VSLKTQGKRKFPLTTQEATGDQGMVLSLIDLCLARSPKEGQTRHQVSMKNLALPPSDTSNGPACVKREHLSLLGKYDAMAG